MKKMNSTSVFFAAGRPFSPIYSLAMKIREKLYGTKIWSQASVQVPVISVGNLTLGGSGKTPVVQYLARLLQASGYTPAVISRGYGGKTFHPVNIVSDGETVFLDADEAGDEPRLLAETLAGVPVLTGRKRIVPARKAISMGADVLLLDDGFQHLQLKRDIDLVLFNADFLAGNSRVFPGGHLREPVSALHRATCFLLTGVTDANQDRAHKFAELLNSRFPGNNTCFAGYDIAGSFQVDNEGGICPDEKDSINQMTCYGFCGIARPDSFRDTLKGVYKKVVGFSAFSDHVQYTEKEISRIIARAGQAEADCLVTTEKDLVKLRHFSFSLPLHVIQMRVSADNAFDQLILNALSALDFS
ncbi:MAG: tetraacyldisaccharide 4'-kinase [Desulfobulbus propionicus]|nr:MAG: tetraacyldisaccharide 4'-kinase [Desulfobulbus propionicus]